MGGENEKSLAINEKYKVKLQEEKGNNRPISMQKNFIQIQFVKFLY